MRSFPFLTVLSLLLGEHVLSYIPVLSQDPIAPLEQRSQWLNDGCQPRVIQMNHSCVSACNLLIRKIYSNIEYLYSIYHNISVYWYILTALIFSLFFSHWSIVLLNNCLSIWKFLFKHVFYWLKPSTTAANGGLVSQTQTLMMTDDSLNNTKDEAQEISVCHRLTEVRDENTLLLE